MEMEMGLVEEEHEDLVRLGLLTRGQWASDEQSESEVPPEQQQQMNVWRNKSGGVKMGPGKSEAICAPYPWATSRRAVTQPLEQVVGSGVSEVWGLVACKRCGRRFWMSCPVERGWSEVSGFVRERKEEMHHRAPPRWMAPPLPGCPHCHHPACVTPVLGKKRSINWLFLLLSQLLGCCRLSHLKYFCKHTNNHRTGAKDRLLYLTYLAICKQLDPNGPFDP